MTKDFSTITIVTGEQFEHIKVSLQVLESTTAYVEKVGAAQNLINCLNVMSLEATSVGAEDKFEKEKEVEVWG